MKAKLWFKAIMMISIIATLACRQGIANESNLDRVSNNTMNQPNDQKMSELLKVTISQLIARAEIRPPLGIPPQPDRDIGFASIFVSLENHQEIDRSVTIQSVKIYSIADNQLQSFAFEPKEIVLKPLENSMIDIQLTNKTGYMGQGKVKAIVTYQIGDQISEIESQPVTVDIR